MSRRKSHNPKKVFWIVIGLSFLVVTLTAIASSILGSPQAAGDTLSVVKLQGAVVYPTGATPQADTVSLVRVTNSGEKVIKESIALSQTDNAQSQDKKNRGFSSLHVIPLLDPKGLPLKSD